MCPKCQMSWSSGRIPGGCGKWRRRAAILSPGAQNVIVGAAKVKPVSEAREPPRECPVSQIVEVGKAE